MEKKFWERFAALSFRAGTSSATILNSFATMVPWRKTSLQPSATTESDRSGSETTINSGDMAGILMIAVQALEKRTAELIQKEAQMALLAARLEALELRQNHSIQKTAEKSLG